MAEVARKIKGANTRIIAEPGNKEFKGIKMKAIWQLVDSIIIPILTYACESWMRTKEEKPKLQTIRNDAIKTILYLPNGTPTTILLNETGHIPVEYTITKKQILQAKRIDEMKSDSLIKDATIASKSTWRKMIDKKVEDLHIKDVMTVTKKTSKSPNPKRNRG